MTRPPDPQLLGFLEACDPHIAAGIAELERHYVRRYIQGGNRKERRREFGQTPSRINVPPVILSPAI